MRWTILKKLMISFVAVGLIPLIVVGVLALKDARRIGYDASTDAKTLGTEVLSDTRETITALVGDSLLRVGHQISHKVGDTLREREGDARIVAATISPLSDDTRSVENLLLGFADSRTAVYRYNKGTDLSPQEVSIQLPLYSEVAFVNAAGKELVRIVDGKPVTELRDVSVAANTEFRNEDYFARTINLADGEVYVSRVHTWFLSEKEARKGADPGSKDWNIVVGRDDMKRGVIRFCTKVTTKAGLAGIAVLSLDYRHLQALTKHIDPAELKPVLSTSYEGNYILMFDDLGDTIVHPKPNNIRGYLDDGTLAHRNTVKNPGGIFNLKYFDKTKSYQEIFAQTIGRGESMVTSAVDLKGRNKMTVSVPIPYKMGEYEKSGLFGGLMLSVNTDRFYASATEAEKRISAQIAQTNSRIRLSTEGMQTKNTILMVTAGTILLGLLLGIGAAITLSRPIRSLTRVAQEISNGNVDVQIPNIRTDDEVKDLAESLRSVLAAIDFFRDELGMNNDRKER